MSISIYRVRDEFNAANHREFLMDTDSDVSELPGLETCAAGSKARAVDSSNVYMLSNSNKWVLQTRNSSGSGGSGNSGDSLIKSVDTTNFMVSADGKLNLNDLPISKITGLEDALGSMVEKIDGKGLSTNDFTDEMKAALVEIIDGGNVATESAPGTVLSSTEENHVSVNPTTGKMEINSVNISKLIQSEDDVLVINCGNAG